MKKLITLLAIALLTAGTTFGNNDNTSTAGSKQTPAISSQISAPGSDFITVTINDMNGKVVYTETFANGNTNFKLNISNKLSKGIYTVTVVADGQTMTQKLVVE
jgi:hypothetical protein